MIQEQTIFDTSDIDYLVKNLTPEQLRQEVYSHDVQRAYMVKERWPNYMDEDNCYWYAFGKVCEQALDIHKSTQPKEQIGTGEASARAVKEANDIVEVVSRHTKLRKTGQEHTGKCPFHIDKQPSFNVNPAKQIFHCFSCGQAGDVIDFIKLAENLNTGQAIEFLGGGNKRQRVGIKL